MATHTSEYLTTKEVAELLRIKERRLYDLAAAGEIPHTRALGKLLFQRSQLNAWLASHGTGVAPATAPQTPRVLLGSHDPLLEWTLRESGSGLATFFDGSLDGLDRFAKNEGIATGLHLHAPDGDEWNRPMVAERFAAENVVLVEWAWRQRGLIVAAKNPKKIKEIKDLKGLRVASRQPQSATQELAVRLLAQENLSEHDVLFAHPVRTETEAGLIVAEEQADAAFGLQSVARQYRLGFIPLVRERFDLLVRRAEWFEESFQRLIEFTRSATFESKIVNFPDYDFSALWRVHFNGQAR